MEEELVITRQEVSERAVVSHQSGLSRGKGRHQKTRGLLKRVVSHKTVLSLWVSHGRGRYQKTRGLCVSHQTVLSLWVSHGRGRYQKTRGLCVSHQTVLSLWVSHGRGRYQKTRGLLKRCCVSPKWSFTLGFTT